MDSLTKTQCWNLPNNIIKDQNRRWRELVIINIPSINKSNVNEYVIKNIPELEYQFRWEAMTDNQRLQEKFKYRSTYSKDRENGYYDGYELHLDDNE